MTRLPEEEKSWFEDNWLIIMIFCAVIVLVTILSAVICCVQKNKTIGILKKKLVLAERRAAYNTSTPSTISGSTPDSNKEKYEASASQNDSSTSKQEKVAVPKI